MKELLCVNLNK